MFRPFPDRLPPIALAVVAACSSSSPSGSPAQPGSPPTEEQAFSYTTNLILAHVTEGTESGTAIVDTGNPFVLLDPVTFTSVAHLPQNGADVPSLIIGRVTATGVYVVPTADGLSSPDPAFPLAANLGCTGICKFVASFNYRDVALTLGSAASTPPTGLLPETIMDFSFEGGSVVGGVTIPRSRVVVTVTLEATDYTMILDTGATSVTVSQAAFSAITADGRAQISGGSVETTAGMSASALARVASVTVGGVTANSVVVAHDSSFVANLQAISTDVGRTIDGSLGGTYLHNFYVTIDYPSRKLHLAPYTSTDFAIDPAERIGIAPGTLPGGGYGVALATGDAVSKGVAIGDVIVSIDGEDLGALTVSQVSLLFFGKVGSTRMVTFGAAATLSNQSVPILVEELLPLTAGK